jgi:HEPN domain-containing protein
MMPAAFEKDPAHWLFRLSPDEWISAALGELDRAERAYAANDARAGLAGAKRAAGMALNGALIVAPNEAYGRSYVDHVRALAADAGAPSAVRAACALLMEAHAPSHTLLSLRSRAADTKITEAARDVVAHAWAVVNGHANG